MPQNFHSVSRIGIIETKEGQRLHQFRSRFFVVLPVVAIQSRKFGRVVGLAACVDFVGLNSFERGAMISFARAGLYLRGRQTTDDIPITVR